MQQSSSAWARWAPPVTRNLIIINFIIYFASVLLLRRGFDLAEVSGLHYFESSAFSDTAKVSVWVLKSSTH